MSDYKLEIKQIVDYPRCRMYREFVQTLIADRSIHTHGCSGLFHYFITYTLLGRDKLVKYSITGWRFHNTVLDYNCPCQKDVGFFFLPVAVASELIGTGKCSEMDVVLDLWLSAIYNDERVQGSDVGPVPL